MKPGLKRALSIAFLLLFWCIFDYSQDQVYSTNPEKSAEVVDPWSYLKADGVYVLTDPTPFATDEKTVGSVVWCHLHQLVSGEAYQEQLETMFEMGKLTILDEGTEFRILALNGQTFHTSVVIEELDSGHTFYFSPFEYLQQSKRFSFPFRRIR